MSDCIETTWPRTAKGYGRTRVRGVSWGAHRYYWTLANGPIPDGMCVLHRCDNPPCVNLDHLFLGTVADNNADMRAKDRQVRGDRVGTSKLTASDVQSIRDRRSRGVNARELAAEYGLHPRHIRAIVTGQRWADGGERP